MYYIYHIAFLFSVIFSMAYKPNRISQKAITRELKLKKNTVFAILSFFPIFLISGIRYGVGSDYFDYALSFQQIISNSTGKWTVGINDIGYVYLCKFIGLFSSEPSSFFLVTSFLSIGILFIAIYEQSSKPWMSILIYFFITYYYFNFTLVRNMLGISIFVYATKYIREKKLIPYITFCLIAASIHNTLLITIPVYFLFNVKLEEKILKYLGAVLALLAVVRPFMGKLIVYIASNTRYGLYYFKEYYDGSTDYIWLFVHLIILIVLYSVWRKVEVENKDNLGLLMQFITVVIALYSQFIPLAFRVMFVFAVPQIITIPNAINNIKNKSSRKTYTVIICAFFFVLYLLIAYVKQWNTVIPYKTIFGL